VRRRSDLAAYVAMRGALAAVRVLPRPVALAAGATIGRAARDLLRLRRRVTDDNLAAAFPELSAADRARIARGVYAHFGRMAVDSLRLSAVGPQAIVPLVAASDFFRLIDELLARRRGVILLTGHVGNWELGAACVAARGYRVAGVVKPPANRYVARHAERVRERLGIETIPMPEAREGVPEALAANKIVGLVADQGALRSNTWSPFFDRPTKTPPGPGLFAVRSGAPVIFGAFIARPDGGYEIVSEVLAEEVTGKPEDAVQQIADAFRARLEALVRRVPDQYLWTHRLWKHQPPPLAAP
jgi:KDO2-lipid IV(A) lauroyltransferase